MRIINLFGSDTILIDDYPNMLRGYTSEHGSLTDSVNGLTQRETRRPYSISLRTNLRYSTTLRGGSVRGLYGTLRALKDQPVLSPFWPALSFWSQRAAAPIKGGLYLAFKKDRSQLEVYESGPEPGWPLANDYVVPLIFGYARTSPRLQYIASNVLIASLDIEEDAQAGYALTFTAGAVVDGPTPAGYSGPIKLIPFEPSFEDVQNALEVEVIRQRLGFRRQSVRTFYEHDPFETQTAPFKFTTLEAASEFLSWFQERAGQGESFWVQSAYSLAELSVAALAAATSVTIADPTAVLVGDYLCAQRTVFDTPHVALVDVKDENVLFLHAAFGVALAQGQQLRRLMLARLKDSTVKIDWRSPSLSVARLSWIEVPSEEVIAADETIGTTLGRLPQRALFYEFQVINGDFLDRYTSFEADVLNYNNNFIFAATKDIDHDDITLSTDLNADEVIVTCDVRAIPRVLAFAQGDLEFPLFVRIYQVDVDSDFHYVNGTIQQMFAGEVVEADVTGDKIALRCLTGGTILDANMPRVVFQRTCNNTLFDAGCKLAKADWTFTGTVQAIAAGYPFGLVLNGVARVSGPAVTFDGGWFSGGWLEFGVDDTLQRRACLYSSVVSGGLMSITIDRDFSPMPGVGDTLTLFPGCDGQFSTCIAKFNNKDNFLGHPFMPVANPSAASYSRNSGSGAKK